MIIAETGDGSMSPSLREFGTFLLNPGKARERLSMEFFAPCRRRGFDTTVEQAKIKSAKKLFADLNIMESL